MNRLWMLMCCCVLTVLPSVVVQAQDAEAFEPYEAWFVMRMNGEKVGYLHTRMALDDAGQIVTTSDSRITIARGATEIKIETGSRFIETRDHRPVEASTRMLMAAMATEQRLVFGEDEWVMTTTSAGRTSTETMEPGSTDWSTPAASMLEAEQAIARGDERIEVTNFDLGAGTDPIRTVMTLVEHGEVEVFGRLVPASLWDAEVSMYPGIAMQMWVDDRGQPVVQSVPLGPGMDVQIVLADEQLALAEFDAPEMMASTLITPDRKIENPRTLRRAVYEISGPGLDALDRDSVPTAGFQTVEWLDEDTMRITIDMGFQTPGPGLGDDEPGFLAATNALNHEDEVVAGLVEDALADAAGDGPSAVAQALRAFVADYIDEKNLSVGFATASEVARTGEGDCTEHGCLLAAMLRGAGIPSRTVTGIVYADQFLGGRDIFGYHMWTQAWIETADGQGLWIDLDAAFPGQVNHFDATHIALSTSAQADDAFINDMVAMLPLMNGLEVKVVELEWAE